MSGGKGGSQSTEVEIPQWMEDAGRKQLSRSEDIQQMGYMPYYGPDVAAFTPLQEAGMQSAANAGSAFGLAPEGMNAMQGMPEAQTFAGGVRGYSSAPLFEQALAELQERAPGAMDIYRNQFASNFAPGEDNQGDFYRDPSKTYEMREDAQGPLENMMNRPTETLQYNPVTGKYEMTPVGGAAFGPGFRGGRY